MQQGLTYKLRWAYHRRMNCSLKYAADLVGGYGALAEALGISQPAISQWGRKGVPPERVLPIVRATNGRVTPHQLRPDIYPDPGWMPAEYTSESAVTPGDVEPPPGEEREAA